MGAGVHLRDHSGVEHARGGECFQPCDVGTRDEGRRIGEVLVDAGDSGEVDELLGREGLGDRAGGGVGVDVVALTLVVDPHRRNDGDQLLTNEPVQDRRVDALHVTDESELGVAPNGRDESGVFTRQADGVGTVAVQRRDDPTVHLADQGHPGNVDRLGVGDPQAVDELRLLAEPAHERGDMRTSPVHDDGIHPHEAHEHDVLCEETREVWIVHGVAAVLDDDGTATELTDVRERLRQDVGLRARDLVAIDSLGIAHEVPRFSSMYAYERSVNVTLASPEPRWRSQSIVSSRSVIAAPSAASSCAAATPWNDGPPIPIGARSAMAAPLASTSTVSLVLMDPSTRSVLYESVIASPSAARNARASIAASVVMTASIVAIAGASIAAPLAMPPTVYSTPSAEPVATATLRTVSVVRMASAAASALAPSGPSWATRPGMPASSGAIGNGIPISPVEHTRTSAGSTPRPAAVRSHIRRASALPAGPVAALALPELSTTAAAWPSWRCSRVTSTGAAVARLVVNTPAAVTGRAGLTATTARSATPASFTPQASPPATNPRAASTLMGRPRQSGTRSLRPGPAACSRLGAPGPTHPSPGCRSRRARAPSPCARPPVR